LISSLERLRVGGAFFLSVLLLGQPLATFAAPPPPTAFADRSTLSILRGESGYSERAREPVVAAIDGQEVAVGDRLITGPDANLVLTFFEGSTFTLTPNTDIVVERLQGDRTTRDFSLQLNAGTIWARVVNFATSAATFQVKTPSAVAVVRGSQIGARVLADGSFQCWTREGAMSVLTTGGQQADLVAGETVLVQPDGQLSASRPFEPSASVLRFLVRGNVWPLVVHPDGGANGIVEPGVVVSQTFGALVTEPRRGDDAMAFEVPANVNGTYTLVLEGTAAGSYAILATGLLAPIYAGTPDPEERLLGAAEIVGEIGLGERLAVDLAVVVERQGQPDAVLSSINVSASYGVSGPSGPAKVYVSPVELEKLASRP